MAHATNLPQSRRSDGRAVQPSSHPPQTAPAAASQEMPGPERAAVLLLALGNQYGAKIWAQLDDDELRQLGVAMSTLGTVTAAMVEARMVEFVTRLSSSGAVMGNFDATERLLRQFLPG